MCEYAYKLAEEFHAFYKSCRVVDTDERHERLALCAAARTTLGRTLELLTIEPLEQV